ncbi:LPS export ABC transporter periplasmic protein LptC, partial [Flavobacteriaceae bacterium]|nr:LPS export ABC transporter periplasmic protein LptC [Flavobacteriaceae bacterium]
MNLLRVLVLFFLFSCEDNFQEIQNINNKNILPLGVTENLKLIYTDSAKVKAILYSSLNKDYTNKPF